MKKRKILYLFPLAALILSGCTFQEGYETAKNFIGNNVYFPVRNFFAGLFGKAQVDPTKKDDKQGEDQKPSGEQGGEEGGGQGGGGQATETVHGSLEQPLSVSEFRAAVDGLVDFTKVESGKTVVAENDVFYLKAKVSSNTAPNNDGEINYLNLVDPSNSSLAVTGYWIVVDESVTDTITKDSLKEGLVTVKGYGALYNHSSKGKTYEIMKKDEDNRAKLLKVEMPQEVTEPTKLEKTLAEIVASTPTKAQAYISSAKIKAWVNDKQETQTAMSEYGSMILTDDTNDVFVYGASPVAGDLKWGKYSGEYSYSSSKAFKTNAVTKDLKVGDQIDFYGIYFEYNGVKEMNIIVTGKTEVKVESVSLPESKSMQVGDPDLELTAVVKPDEADQTVTWTSDNTEAATVENGMVHAVAPGTAKIKATSVKDTTKFAECTVTVSAAQKTLTSVEVKTMPKTTYTEGELLDLSDLVLTLHYSDDSTAEATSGYTTNIALDHPLTSEDTSLVISFNGVAAPAITLTINPKPQTQTTVYKVENTASTSAESDVAKVYEWLVKESGESVITGVEAVTKVYAGASGGADANKWESGNLIKLGTSSAAGSIIFQLASSAVVKSITLKGYGWKNTLVVKAGTSSCTAGAFTVADKTAVEGNQAATVAFNSDLFAVGSLRISTNNTSLLITEISLETTVEPTQKITFNANGTSVEGMPGNLASFAGSRSLADLDEPTREGFDFKGWSLTSDGAVVESITVADEDIQLYAIWEEKATVNYIECELQVGQLLITSSYDDETYYLPTATSASSAPQAIKFGDVKSIETTELWTVSKDGDNWVFTNAEGNHLLATNTNNGVRIDSANCSWTYSDGSLKVSNLTRYLGVYNKQDWRSYGASDHGNYHGSGTSLKFYKVA